MRIETTRVAAPVLLRHVGAFHTGTADLVRQALPLVTAALARGEPVASALRPETERALLEAAGRPPGLITLDPPGGPDGLSGQTTASRRARELRELAAGAGAVTVVSEHDSRFDGADGRFWTELDAATTVALAELPVDMTCFFPEVPLHLEVLAGAVRNHPLLLAGDGARPNPYFLGPREVLLGRPAPAPLLLGPPDVRVRFDAWQLHEVRASVEHAVAVSGFDPSRAEDVVLAVNEVATNAVEHGAQEADLYIWNRPEGLVCEVHDRGALEDPLPGLCPPHPGEARGRGIWIARQLCDVLHVWTDADGTHVRMRAAA
ncbi:MAG TPA: ATP-binding protein [Pseudonocardia sp.]|nr:ATP-binding protein [Pseudonocardia sp.]